MLQKLSKCEVNAASYGYFSNLMPLRLYMKSNFDVIKLSKNVIVANFKAPELKFYPFTATPILREITFSGIQTVQKC